MSCCNSWNGRRKVDRTDIQPDSSLERGSEYRAVLTDSDIAPTTAHRWQTVANHAAEVKLRAERKAGELLTTLAEQSKEEQRRGNRYTLESYQADNSLETPYRAALADTATPIATAQRWQTVANHAAEVKLRAERKAGELLQQLERAPHDRGNQHVAKFQPGIQPESEYRAVLTDSDIAPTTAHRWQTVAQVRILNVKHCG